MVSQPAWIAAEGALLMAMKVPPRISFPTLALSALMVATLAYGVPSAPVPSWGASGSGSGALLSPVAIALARDRVYVTDFDNDRIHVFTRAGATLLDWGRTGSGAGCFRGPAGVAIGLDESVYVTDLYNHRVQKFTADGHFVASWPAGSDDAAPCGIALGPDDRIYVTDLDAGRVYSWTSDGRPLGAWGTRGHGPGELFEPWGIAIDPSGEVYVADHGNHRVQRFSSEGVYRGEWGEKGRGDGRLLGPMGLAIGGDGLYLTDLIGDRVQRLSRDGTLASVWRGSPGGAEASFAVPALALDAGGDILLAETGRHQVTRIPAASVASPAAAPTAFALTPIAQTLRGGVATFQLTIPIPGVLGAEIFSVDGRRVYTVPDASCPPGEHRILWNAHSNGGRRAPAGLYFVRVHFDDGVRDITRSARIVVLH